MARLELGALSTGLDRHARHLRRGAAKLAVEATTLEVDPEAVVVDLFDGAAAERWRLVGELGAALCDPLPLLLERRAWRVGNGPVVRCVARAAAIDEPIDVSERACCLEGVLLRAAEV